MAHVAGSPSPHSLVAMPPHAWSTEHQHSTSQSHRLSLPAYPTSSSMLPPHAWNSTHQDANIHQLHSSVSSDLTHPTDRVDHHNADTIFRDLFNLRIADDTSPESTASLQPQLALQSNGVSTQNTHQPPLLHRDVFSHSDPDSDHHDIPDHLDHTQQSLKHFPSQLSSLPFLQHHLQQHHHDPSITDPISGTHRASFTPHGPFASSALSGRRHSSQGALFRSSSISDQSPRTSNPSRSHPPSVPPHTGPRIKNDLYKTELCRSFAENAGFCKYGSKCQFAHGEEELRPVRRHPRYKTKLCRNFVNNGSCPYDTRCRFIHANDLPFVSVPTLSGLHQSSVSTAPGSDITEQARYDTTNVAGEDYAEHLRRILTMTPGSSAGSMSASEGQSIPLSSPHASPPAEVDPGHSFLNGSEKKSSGHVTYGGQIGKRNSSVVQADHGYHANANVFHDYPDSAFNQPYIPLVTTKSEGTFQSSTSGCDSVTAGAGTLRETQAVGNGDLGTVFRPPRELPATEIFGPEPEVTAASQENVSQCTSAQNNVNLDGDDAIRESATKATPSNVTRCRLPVFRNITSDGDSA